MSNSLQKLYTTGRLGNSHSDLCMIVADIAKIPIQEVYVDKDKDAEMAKKMPAGFTLTYPFLELEDGTILT